MLMRDWNPLQILQSPAHFKTLNIWLSFRKDNFTKFFTGKSCLPTEKRGRLLIVDLNHYVHIWTELALEQRSAKRYGNLAKQDPGKARQSS